MRWSTLYLNFKNEQTSLLTEPPVPDAMNIFMKILAAVVFGCELINCLFFRLPGTLFFHAADVLVQNPETVSITLFDSVASLPTCRQPLDCICAIPRWFCMVASLFLFIFDALSLGVGVVATELLGAVALLVGLCVPLETNSDESCGWLWHQKFAVRTTESEFCSAGMPRSHCGRSLVLETMTMPPMRCKQKGLRQEGNPAMERSKGGEPKTSMLHMDKPMIY